MLREFMGQINLIWGVLGVWLLAMLTNHAFDCRRRGSAGQALATALLVFFTFETLMRFMIWYYINTGIRDIKPFLTFVALGATFGMICICRVLTPKSWGRYRWLIPILILVMAIAHFIIEEGLASEPAPIDIIGRT